MRTLTCISKDSYGYENESLDFFYNNFKVFTQYNQKLNRGGKTLILREIATSEDLISSGKYIKESWFRKIVSTLKAHNYEISIDDIKGAINKQRV